LLEELRKHVDVFVVDFYREKASIIGEVSSPRKICEAYKAIKRENPSIIHVQFTTAIYPKAAFIALISLLKTQQKPIVLTQHEVIPERRRVKLRTAYEKLVYDEVDAVIAHSEHVKNYLLNLGVPTEKVTVIPHGVYITPTIDQGKARERLGFDKNGRLILIFGYLSPHKGVEYAIRAMERIRKKFDKVKLFVVGDVHPLSRDEAYVRKLRKIADTWGVVDDVIFTGFVADELVPYYLRAADVLLLPYTRATESGVLHLAIGAELPVVASNVRGLEVVSKREIGISVPPCNGESIARAVETLLEGGWFYQKCKRGCRLLMRERSWGEVAKAHVHLYKGLKP
jgi:glycosyltransferase involved in cell wall biosynthesis